MCAPTVEPPSSSSSSSSSPSSTTKEKKVDESPASKKNVDHHNGFLYGTISLAMIVTASSVTMGHLQSKRDSLGCDSMCIGSMTSARSTLALIGSTIMGKFSDWKLLDQFGGARKICLLIGIVASALDVSISSTATSIDALWISMIAPALFQQNFNILKALFGEYHDESASAAERAGSVGKLGMAAGLAFMVGPLASSTFFQTYDQAAWFASLCLFISFWFVYLLPSPSSSSSSSSSPSGTTTKKVDDEEKESGNVTKENAQNKKDTKKKEASFYSWLIPDLVPAARTPPAIFIMIARICMTLSFHIFQTIWTVALKERFHFGPKEYGRYFGFIGLAFAMSQGYVAKFLLKRYGNTNRGRANLLMICATILGGGRMFAYQLHDIRIVYVLFIFIISALGVINTIFTADTSKIASPQELGSLFGVLGSVESLAGIIGPILGGTLASNIHPVNGPLFAVVGLYSIVFFMVYFGYEQTVACYTLSDKKVVEGTKKKYENDISMNKEE